MGRWGSRTRLEVFVALLNVRQRVLPRSDKSMMGGWVDGWMVDDGGMETQIHHACLLGIVFRVYGHEPRLGYN